MFRFEQVREAHRAMEAGEARKMMVVHGWPSRHIAISVSVIGTRTRYRRHPGRVPLIG